MTYFSAFICLRFNVSTLSDYHRLSSTVIHSATIIEMFQDHSYKLPTEQLVRGSLHFTSLSENLGILALIRSK